MDYLKEPLVAAYLIDCKIRGMSQRSFPGYHAALRSYLKYLDEKPVFRRTGKRRRKRVYGI